MERTGNQITGTGTNNINITGAGNLTLETVYIETGGGRYPEFVYKSSPRKKTAIKKNSTVSDKESYPRGLVRAGTTSD